MQLKTRVPVGINSIAKLMGMDEAEIQAWPYFTEMRDFMRDYNLKALTKKQLIERLEEISIKCANDKIYYYSIGLDRAISAIKTIY